MKIFPEINVDIEFMEDLVNLLKKHKMDKRCGTKAHIIAGQIYCDLASIAGLIDDMRKDEVTE